MIDDESTPQTATVLVMDDEPIVLESLVKAVELLGYQPLAAARGEEAIRIFEEAMTQGIRVRAAILDLTIRDGLGGRETLAELRQMDIDLKAIASSGFGDNLANYAENGFNAMIEKPFRIQDLEAVLSRTIG